MPVREKIAISLSKAVLKLVDAHAQGRSRSRCIEEALLRALRAREWERLSEETDPGEAAEQAEWAESSFALVDTELSRHETRRATMESPNGRRRR